jgi:hypothetical protein
MSMRASKAMRRTSARFKDMVYYGAPGEDRSRPNTTNPCPTRAETVR